MTNHPATTAVEPVSLAVSDSDERFYVRRIYCVGRNYVSHIREMAEADERDDPFFFQKPRDAVVPNGGTVQVPPATTSFEFEGELVIAIGVGGQDIAVADAESHIFGAACGLDMTRRDLQFEARDRSWPWEMGKSFDQSAPIGDIRRVDSLDALGEGRLRLQVNGETRQDTQLSLMIWSPAEIVSRLSAQYRLEPGDVIMTGTPAGVGTVGPGDHITVDVTGIETLAITIAA